MSGETRDVVAFCACQIKDDEGESEDRGPAVDRFRSLLIRHGWTDGSTHTSTTYRILRGKATMTPLNLWPLERNFNQRAGRNFQNMLITYSNTKGGGPPAQTNVRLGAAQVAPGASNVIGRHFIVVEIRA